MKYCGISLKQLINLAHFEEFEKNQYIIQLFLRILQFIFHIFAKIYTNKSCLS
jgi:hypothetical protein